MVADIGWEEGAGCEDDVGRESAAITFALETGLPLGSDEMPAPLLPKDLAVVDELPAASSILAPLVLWWRPSSTLFHLLKR